MPNQTKKKKAKHTLGAAEAAEFLRHLADQLESGQVSFAEEDLALKGQVKIKESYKAKPGKAGLKVELKFSLPGILPETREPEQTLEPDPEVHGDEPPTPAAEAQPSEADPQPEDYADREIPSSYKKLKKRMAKDFKAIAKPLQSGQLPNLDLARAFRDDCLHMTSFKGKGDVNYEAFRQEAQAFAAAIESGDQAGAREAVRVLAKMEKDCHHEFK